MKLTLTLLTLAASVIAAPIAIPEAEPNAEAAPQGTYGNYGKPPIICPSMLGRGKLMFVGTYGAPATPPSGGYGSYGKYAPPTGGYGSYGTYKNT